MCYVNLNIWDNIPGNMQREILRISMFRNEREGAMPRKRERLYAFG